MNLRLGEKSKIGQHVIILIKDNCDVEGYEKFDGFCIKDTNPENRPGLSKFEIIIDGAYLDIEEKIHINNNKFKENFAKCLEHLLTKKKEGLKIKIAIFTDFIMNQFVAAAFKILDLTSEDFNITLFVNSLEEYKLYEKAFEMVDNSQKVKEIAGEYAKALVVQAKDVLHPMFLNILGLKPDLTGKRVAIIDTHNFYHRTYHGMPDMRNSKGAHTTLAKALTTFLKSIVKENFDYIVFASEGKNGIRYKIYPEYKANREETPIELKSQIAFCNNLVRSIGMMVVEEEGFEADDVIGSYSKAFSVAGADVTIYTTDKDMYQLISEKVVIYDPMKLKFIRESECMEKFSVTPDKVIWALTLSGDTSDNVPGVKGVGPKKASQLINQYGDLKGIYENVNDVPGKLKEYLIENKENAFMSYELVRLYDFLADEINFDDFKFPKYDLFYPIKKDLEELEINL